MEESKQQLLRMAGLGKQVDLVNEGKCPTCSKDVLLTNLEYSKISKMEYKPLRLGFKDEHSHKEFTISGMCQACQDSTFGR